ncbi:MAG: acyltransferase [Bacteroidales bacterium]|nr:acyltransferase [Candidatus Minthousia equi]
MIAGLNTKPRYEILDGLRGVAAMIVVAFHLFETYSPGVTGQILNHGYLAVDFFFVLSGFVIGYAYDDRWSKGMGTWTFFKRRLIRLHPLLIMGTLVGAALFFLTGDHPDFPLVNNTEWWQVLLVMAFCFTLLPLPSTMDIRGWAETNPLNGAIWSLQWEYIANILYAFVLRRLSKVFLGILVAVGAVLTIILCLNIDVTGWLSAREYATNTVIGGWSTTPEQLQIGVTRLLYPFLCGLLLSRMPKLRIHISNGFWWCSLMIAAILVVPRIGGANPENFWMNGLYEAVAILVLFPLIVCIGAGSSEMGGKSFRVCKFLGDISYPLYVTHYPLVYLQMSFATTHADAPLGVHVMVAVSLFLIAVGMAYAFLKLYDLPLRKWLSEKLLKTR